MTRSTRQHELEALAHMVEAYGADLARWPAGGAQRFQPLLASDREAQLLLRDAAVLDRLLATAEPGDARVPDGLAERILAQLPAATTAAAGIGAATPTPAGPEQGAEASVVVPFRQRRGGPLSLPLPVGTAVRRGIAGRQSMAAGVLVASLMLGVLAGFGASGDPLLFDVADRLGVTRVVEPGQLVLNDSGYDFEEDVL